MADSDPSHQLDEQRKLEEQQPKPSPEVEEQVEEGSAQGVVGGDEDREPPEFDYERRGKPQQVVKGSGGKK